MLILGENGRVFGGYNDVPWLGKDKVSTNKHEKHKSFLFYSKKNFVDEDEVKLDDMDDDLFHFKRCKGDDEIYHSENAGPNFIDLEVKGPAGNSRIRNHKNYKLIPGDIEECEPDPKEPNKHDIQPFKYVTYEVYEAEDILPEE